MTVVDDTMAKQAKKDIKRLRAASRPLRRCLTYHNCFWCEQPIFLGEHYYDGGYGCRIIRPVSSEPKLLEREEAEMPSDSERCLQSVRSPMGRKAQCRNPRTDGNFCHQHAQMYKSINKGLRVISSIDQSNVRESVKELAEAALHSLERIDTVKLAALGCDTDAGAVGDARRLLDRLLVEADLLKGNES